MPRMNILNTVEREAFNSPPVFSSFQRKQYFDFPSKLGRFAAGLRNPASQLGFFLSAGYFKAARRFFSPGSFHPRDIEYVARQLEQSDYGSTEAHESEHYQSDESSIVQATTQVTTASHPTAEALL